MCVTHVPTKSGLLSGPKNVRGNLSLLAAKFDLSKIEWMVDASWPQQLPQICLIYPQDDILNEFFRLSFWQCI